MFWYFGGGDGGAEGGCRVARRKEACFVLFYFLTVNAALKLSLQDISKLQMIAILGNQSPGPGTWQAQFLIKKWQNCLGTGLG